MLCPPHPPPPPKNFLTPADFCGLYSYWVNAQADAQLSAEYFSWSAKRRSQWSEPCKHGVASRRSAPATRLEIAAQGNRASTEPAGTV